MTRTWTKFFQAAVVILGVAALAFLLGEPHVEGRNAHATLFQIYFRDPLLAYAYAGSLPFFVGLYQAFKALGYAGRNEASSPAMLAALRRIRGCARFLMIVVAAGEAFLLLGPSDDRAGGVFMGVLVIVGSVLVAAVASALERQLAQP